MSNEPTFTIPYLTTQAREKIDSVIEGSIFAGNRIVRMIEEILGEEVTKGETIEAFSGHLAAFENSTNSTEGLSIQIWDILADIENSTRISSGNYFQRVHVTLTESGAQQYTYPIFIEVGDAPLTTSQVEGIICDHFSVSANLDSPGDFGESYWTDYQNAISFDITNKRYSKDSEIIADMNGMNIFYAN